MASFEEDYKGNGEVAALALTLTYPPDGIVVRSGGAMQGAVHMEAFLDGVSIGTLTSVSENGGLGAVKLIFTTVGSGGSRIENRFATLWDCFIDTSAGDETKELKIKLSASGNYGSMLRVQSHIGMTPLNRQVSTGPAKTTVQGHYEVTYTYANLAEYESLRTGV